MKTILLTGATDGIGLEAAKMFVEQGHKVLIHGRNEGRLEAAKKLLLEINQNAKIEMYLADLSDLEAVGQMADTLLKKGETLDVLINNAGVFIVPESSRVTKDGLDVRFVVNMIAPYILTKKLMPLLAKSSRVVNLSSAAQAPVDIEGILANKTFEPNAAYAGSKLGITMWTMSMAEKYPEGPIFIAVNPKSFLGSKMVQEAYNTKGHDMRIGGQIIYDAALSDKFATANGKYFDNDYGVFSDPHPAAFDAINRAELIKMLEKYC